MASDTPLQAIGAYLLAIANAHPQDRSDASVKLQTDDTKALNSLNACLHEAAESDTPSNEEEYLRKSLFLFYNAANVFAGAISKKPEKRKQLCNQIEEILSASNGNDVQPAALSKKQDLDQSSPRPALCSGSSTQKPAASKLPELLSPLLSPLASKVVGTSSTNSRPDLGRRSESDNFEEHDLMKCWTLMVRLENKSHSNYEALLSESGWYNFVSMCQFYSSNLDECKKLYEELLGLPLVASDPAAKALAFWQSAMELEMRRESDPLRLYFYRWQLVKFRSSVLEIARPPQATKQNQRGSSTSPSRFHDIPRLEIIAILEKLLKTPLSLSRYPLLQRFILRNGEDHVAENIVNKFDEAEHLRMIMKRFGSGVLALIPPSWQPFPLVWDHVAATIATHVVISCPGVTQLCSLIEDSCMSIMRNSHRGRIPERNLPWRNGELQQSRRMVQSYVRRTSYSTHSAGLLKQLATAKAQGLGLPEEYQSSIQAALDMEARRFCVPTGARSDAVFSYIQPPNTRDPSPPRKPLGSKRVSISCADVCRAANSKERSITLSPEKRKHAQVNR